MKIKKSPTPDAAIQRIEEYRARTDPYSPPEQRAEYLKRKSDFLKELEGIRNRLGDDFFNCREEPVDLGLHNLMIPRYFLPSENHPLMKRDFPKVKLIKGWEKWEPPDRWENLSIDCCQEYWFGHEQKDEGSGPCRNDECPLCMVGDDSYFQGNNLDAVLVPGERIDSQETLFYARFKVFDKYQKKWAEFCNRWNIQPPWNGGLEDICQYFNPNIKVIGVSSMSRLVDANLFCDPAYPIHILIGPWTRKDDIAAVWDEIEKMQKRIYEKQPEKFKTFARDLCWYDLYHDHKQSYFDIEKLWIKYCPDDIDRLAGVEGKDKKIAAKEREGYLKGRGGYDDAGYRRLRTLIRNSIKNTRIKINALAARKTVLAPAS